MTDESNSLEIGREPSPDGRGERPRVGCHALTWGGASLETVLEDVAAAGYAGVEPHTAPIRADPRRVRRLASDAGLAVTGAYWTADFHDPDPGFDVASEARALAEAVRAAGADRLLLGPPMRDRVDGSIEPAHRDAFADHAATVVEAVAGAGSGVVACIHPHYDSVLETPADLAAFDERATDRLDAPTAGEAGPVPLAVDTAHLFLGGFDATATIREHGDRVAHVHLKDVLPVDESARASWPDATRPLGDGAVDLDAAIDALAATGYDGWLVVEQDRTADPGAAARRSRAFLRERGY
jgi:inosose dehydratase